MESGVFEKKLYFLIPFTIFTHEKYHRDDNGGS